jgi:hypothetical protein
MICSGSVNVLKELINLMAGVLLVDRFLEIYQEANADAQLQILSGTVSTVFYVTNKESLMHSQAPVLVHQAFNGTVSIVSAVSVPKDINSMERPVSVHPT